MPAYILLRTPSLEWQRQCFGAILRTILFGALFFSFSTHILRYIFLLEKCAVMIALPHQTDIEREKVSLNRDKYINKHTELRMIWHQNGTEPLIDTDLETHQEIREHISIYRYIYSKEYLVYFFFFFFFELSLDHTKYRHAT